MNSVWIGEILDSWTEADLNASYDTLCTAQLLGASLIKKTHPVQGLSSDSCVESGIGMWYDKIFHFKPDGTPSSGGDEI